MTACTSQQTQRYSNAHIDAGNKRFSAFIKMRLFGDDEWADWPKLADTVNTVQPNLALLAGDAQDKPQVTWIGHSSVLVQYRGFNLLTDPIFAERASPVQFAGPRRITAAAVNAMQLPEIDLVVISHNHYDHLDASSIGALSDKVAHWAVPSGLAKLIRKFAGDAANVTEFRWWQTYDGPDYRVTATPSQHWSGRSFSDRYESLWASWAINVDDFTVWFGGDTGYNAIQFAEIGLRIPDIDLGLIPIGAYEPRSFMKDMHVNPEEAVQIHQDIGARQSIGVHWGTFALTAERPDDPPKKLREALVRQNIPDQEFRALAVGETIQLSP